MLSLKEADGGMEFCVRDSGPGIPPEVLPHVFDRYWQAESTAKDGSGLGLAIAKGFVEAHHGKIWVESTLGRGCRFCFLIPGPKSIAESA